MKLYQKSTKEIYHFDDDQLTHHLFTDKIKDPDFVEIPDTFDVNTQTVNVKTFKITTDNALTLELARVKQKEKMMTQYNAELNANITFKNKTFQGDINSFAAIQELLTAVNNGWVLPANFGWIDATNVSVPCNVTFIKGLSKTLSTRKYTLFGRMQTFKTALSQATTLTQINAVRF